MSIIFDRLRAALSGLAIAALVISVLSAPTVGSGIWRFGVICSLLAVALAVVGKIESELSRPDHGEA